MSIIHMGHEYWSLVQAPHESRFGTIAQLKMVCWLEATAVFRDPLPGMYELSWRMELPSESSTDFHCQWTGTLYDDQHRPLGPSVQYVQPRKPSWSKDVVGKGWFQISFGRIRISDQQRPSLLEMKLFGGNDMWFRDLKLDYAQCFPVDPSSSPPPVPSVKLECPSAATSSESGNTNDSA